MHLDWSMTSLTFCSPKKDESIKNIHDARGGIYKILTSHMLRIYSEILFGDDACWEMMHAGSL